jgi:hypothetical protein
LTPSLAVKNWLDGIVVGCVSAVAAQTSVVMMSIDQGRVPNVMEFSSQARAKYLHR